MFSTSNYFFALEYSEKRTRFIFYYQKTRATVRFDAVMQRNTLLN